MLSSKITFAIQHSNELVECIKKRLSADIEQRFDIEIVSDENINKLGDFITGGIPRLLGATFNTLGHHLLYVFHSLFYAGEWQKNGNEYL